MLIDLDGRTPLLRAQGISKRFGGFAANCGIDLDIHAGERHALLGENGAGKSTLVKMLYGVLRPSAGRLFWQGEPLELPGPAAARTQGIGMVFQEFLLFGALTVLENIALALPAGSMRRLAARVREMAQTYGLGIELDAPVHALSVGERQRVEILRCLLQDPKLLIMDEPTSVLTPQEADALFATLRRLSEDGRAVLYISHRLDEVRSLCDTATVLRQGRVVARCDPRAESAASLASMMIGTVPPSASRAGRPKLSAHPRLVIDGLSVPAQGGPGLRDVSLAVHGGEVVGVAGVAGEGQTELMNALAGEIRTERAGAVRVDGVAMGRSGPGARRLAGMAFVPESRRGKASVGDMPLAENLLLTHHRCEALAPYGWIDRAAAEHWARRVCEAFAVRAPRGHPTAGSLSGGNLQKFVVGREILREPGILVAGQPTWGVDAGAAADIRRTLVALAAEGAAVLVVSQDLDEIFEICDRIAVIHRGSLSAALPAREMTSRRAGLLMGGAEAEVAA